MSKEIGKNSKKLRVESKTCLCCSKPVSNKNDLVDYCSYECQYLDFKKVIG